MQLFRVSVNSAWGQTCLIPVLDITWVSGDLCMTLVWTLACSWDCRKEVSMCYRYKQHFRVSKGLINTGSEWNKHHLFKILVCKDFVLMKNYFLSKSLIWIFFEWFKRNDNNMIIFRFLSRPGRDCLHMLIPSTILPPVCAAPLTPPHHPGMHANSNIMRMPHNSNGQKI